MELLTALVAGILIATLAINRPLTIKIQHEHILPESDGDPYQDPEEKENRFYEDLDKTMSDISNVMGGKNG